MTTSTRFRRLTPAAPLLLVLSLVGCQEEAWREGLVWSPDGHRAALIRGNALYIVDADGTLSAVLASDVSRVAWLGGSERLVVARTRTVRTFSDVAAAIGPARTRAIVARGELIAHLLRNTPPGDDIEDIPGLVADVDLFGVILYVAEHHEDALRQSGETTDDLRAELHALVVGRLVDGRLQWDKTLHEDLGKIAEIRVAPGGAALGFVREADAFAGGGDLSVLVVPSDGAAPAMEIAALSAEHFDWTADGRAIVYPTGSQLVQTEIRASGGRLEAVEPSTRLAEVMFARGARVRCLRDNRVLFNAAERTYPTTEAVGAPEQLFALDRTAERPRLTALVPAERRQQLPASLASFDVSPDGTEVLFTADEGVVVRLRLADGFVERFEQPAGTETASMPLPTWRRPGEFTYVRRMPDREELLLHRGDTELVLNRAWPVELTRLLLGRARPAAPDASEPVSKPPSE